MIKNNVSDKQREKVANKQVDTNLHLLHHLIMLGEDQEVHRVGSLVCVEG